MSFDVKVIGCSTTWTNRPVSSYCLDDDMLIDCGEGTVKYYHKFGIELMDIKNIFITHFHADHFCGIDTYLVSHCKNTNQEKKLTIYGPKGLRRHLDCYKIFAFGEEKAKNIIIDDYINIVEIDGDSQFTAGDYIVSTFELKHGTVVDIAYVFEKDDYSIGFSGDCTCTPNLEKFISKTDVCFLECCSEKTSENHLGYDKYIELESKYKNTKFLAIHCSDNIYRKRKLKIEFAISGKTYRFKRK